MHSRSGLIISKPCGCYPEMGETLTYPLVKSSYPYYEIKTDDIFSKYINMYCKNCNVIYGYSHIHDTSNIYKNGLDTRFLQFLYVQFASYNQEEYKTLDLTDIKYSKHKIPGALRKFLTLSSQLL